MKKAKKNGFTLIELLAVIIILGVLAIIAVPAVITYINGSKKNSYVSIAKNLAGGVRTIANSEKLDMTDNNTTYYIPAEYVDVENSYKSPYGEFTEAYIGVIRDNAGYKYYWTSSDDTGTGVKGIIPIDKLDVDKIESNIEIGTITNQVRTVGIGNREIIKVFDSSNETWETYTVEDTINNALENGEERKEITFPSGKTKSTVTVGDLVSIGNEDFFVLKHDGNNLLLLAKYNLKVGSIYVNSKKTREYTSSDDGYGMQSSESVGRVSENNTFNGTLTFSKTNYWKNNPTGFPFDAYSDKGYLKKHVDNYVNMLGIVVKDARLLTYDEVIELGCVRNNNICSNAPSFLYTTSFWLGTAYSSSDIYASSSMGTYSIVINFYFLSGAFGIRPVIIV